MDLDKTIYSLEALSLVAKAVPVVGAGLEAILALASQACKAAQGIKDNHEAYQELAEEIAGYASAVSKAVQSDVQPQFSSESTSSEPRRAGTMEEIEGLIKVLHQVVEAIEKRRKKDEGRPRKRRRMQELTHEVLNQPDDEKKIKGLRRKVEKSVKCFHISASTRELVSLQRIENNVNDAARERQRDRLQREREFIKQELKPVHTARFDKNGTHKGCLSNTRVDLQDRIHGWTTDGSGSSPNIFFLTGLAGTGKSTVAKSICIQSERERPTISFFISHSSAERRNPERILHSIVYQIAMQHELVRTAVVSALQNGRDIATRPLSEQVAALFTTPLQALDPSAPPTLLVIDALDECDKVDGCEGEELIPLIASAIDLLSGRVKMMVTSREEPKIMEMLKNLGLNTSKSLVRLQNIEDTVVKADIETFYNHHFRLVAGVDRETSWPPKADFDLVVERTGKLFVYAALVVRIVNFEGADPEEQLKEILSLEPSSASDDVFRELDELYLSMLKKAIPTSKSSSSKKVFERIRRVIGSLVLLQAPLNARTLSKLLDEKLSLVRRDISRLSAFLLVPDNAEDSLKIFHPSFFDFILRRCSEARFRIDPTVYNAYLTRRCIAVMNQNLKRDICDIRDISLMNEDVKDLEDRRHRFLPSELQYACKYWAVHISNASNSDGELTKDLNLFCDHHLLHWVEALSLLGKLSASHRYLPGAIRWCKRYEGSKALTATSLLEDVERVVQAYDAPIQAGGLTVYGSVLAFMPECKLYERTKGDMIGRVQVLSERPGSWPAFRQTIEGHDEKVEFVGFSPDGTRIASGSYDETVRVWDAITGRELAQLQGHTRGVTSVGFSPDGTRIASGSRDNTVRVWDAITGRALAQLRGHTSVVTSIGFSPDGTRIASGSWDKTVRVWDAIAGHELAQLQGHTKRVISVRFSPDGTCIASGSWDETVRVWDTVTGRGLAQLHGPTKEVASVGFSPDGTRIASGSGDNTIWVWDAITGRGLAQLQGHTNLVTSIGFSPDGTRIASGSWDKTVRVWDAITGRALAQLPGHTGGVTSVGFSPDGTRITSGSEDKTVRVWDAITGRALAQPQGHAYKVTSIGFSTDGARIASGSWDNTVRVWDAITSRAFAQLQGHTNWVTSVKFSPDGTRIASGSYDETVRVWDAITGRALVQLQGHTDKVTSVGFSPDGTCIASGSEDETVRVWDVITGRELAQLRGHTDKVTSVGFSPGGTRIVSGSWDKTVRVWDAIMGRELARLQGHTKWVTSVGFSPDGTRIASGSYDETVRVWDAITGRALAQVQGHSTWITSVGFSPDSEVRMIAPGSDDTTEPIFMLDVMDRPLAWQVQERTMAVTSVAFSEDSTQLEFKDSAGNQWVLHLGRDFPTNNPLPPLSENSPTIPSSLVLGFDRESGWLTTQQSSDSPPKRLCWIPSERRGVLETFGDLVVLGGLSGLVTILSIPRR